MKPADYYEHYWSDEGFNPRGGEIPSTLRDLLATNLAGVRRCLDVGCGTGERTGELVKSAGVEYVGVDISDNAVREAQRRGVDARKIDDAASLPFDDNSFDAVICIEVLEHLFEPQRAVDEMRRVLSSGGKVIITVPNVAYWRRR